MKKIQALYKEGKIIPLEALELSEGAKISLLILQGDENLKENFFENREKYKFFLPEDYHFSREELYERQSLQKLLLCPLSPRQLNFPRKPNLTKAHTQ